MNFTTNERKVVLLLKKHKIEGMALREIVKELRMDIREVRRILIELQEPKLGWGFASVKKNEKGETTELEKHYFYIGD